MSRYSYYSPVRIWRVFRFLLTLFLIIKDKKRVLIFTPLSPLDLRLVITKLGASFVKLAQVLATRSDFFSSDYLEELKSLHDELEPMSVEASGRVMAKAGLVGAFDSFALAPIAAASIGQVHIAYLKDGQKVAVKLRREGIKEKIAADMFILSRINALFRPLFSHHTKNSIEALISEFTVTILEEASLIKELANLKKFSLIYKDSGIKFPTPYPEYSSDDAIVMSFEEGFRFDDKEALSSRNIDFKKLIDKLVYFYTEQMLVKGYFHADPHPGNLLVSETGELILLDFGMVKSVPKSTRIAIIELIKAANERDYEGYIAASKRLGTIAYEAPKAQLAEFTERMFDIFSNDALSSKNMQALAFGVLESTAKAPFKLPAEAVYILRVSAIIEGLGTTYIENFNGVKDILPILQKNIPRALSDGKTPFGLLKEEILSIPLALKNLKETLKAASDGELKIELSPLQTEWLFKELNEKSRGVIIGFTMLLGGIFMLMFDPELKIFALILFLIGALKLVYK